ncbi:MAG: hypothetical protein AAF617_00485 [Bacteroidota bacterium]
MLLEVAVLFAIVSSLPKKNTRNRRHFYFAVLLTLDYAEYFSDGNTHVQFLNSNKMKKFSLIILTVFLNCALFSCTPNSIAEDDIQFEHQATEGDDDEMREGGDEETSKGG